MKDLERFETFKPGFAAPAHDLSPISTAEEFAICLQQRFAIAQLKNSLAQANFWLGVAHSWATEAKKDENYFTDLWDAIHYTGMAQLRITD